MKKLMLVLVASACCTSFTMNASAQQADHRLAEAAGKESSKTIAAEMANPKVQVVGPFIVFFDWDKDEITPKAAAILDKAAAAYQTTGGQAQVVLAGHTDRSGPQDYNVGMSQQMANNVRSYLVGRGVPDGSITTEAFGESRPLVETADGVREPKNNRVEITFVPGSGS